MPSSPRKVTLLGIVTVFKLGQSEKTPYQISVTVLGITTSTTPVSLNAPPSIFVTPAGIVTFVKLVQPQNKFAGIVFIFFGSVTSERFSQ